MTSGVVGSTDVLACNCMPGHYSRTWPVGDCKSCDGEYATCDGGLAQPFPDRYYWTNPVADGVFRLVLMRFHDDKAAFRRHSCGNKRNLQCTDRSSP